MATNLFAEKVTSEVQVKIINTSLDLANNELVVHINQPWETLTDGIKDALLAEAYRRAKFCGRLREGYGVTFSSPSHSH